MVELYVGIVMPYLGGIIIEMEVKNEPETISQ